MISLSTFFWSEEEKEMKIRGSPTHSSSLQQKKDPDHCARGGQPAQYIQDKPRGEDKPCWGINSIHALSSEASEAEAEAEAGVATSVWADAVAPRTKPSALPRSALDAVGPERRLRSVATLALAMWIKTLAESMSVPASPDGARDDVASCAALRTIGRT